jgi:hypothetical protein
MTWPKCYCGCPVAADKRPERNHAPRQYCSDECMSLNRAAQKFRVQSMAQGFQWSHPGHSHFAIVGIDPREVHDLESVPFDALEG